MKMKIFSTSEDNNKFSEEKNNTNKIIYKNKPLWYMILYSSAT